MRLKTNEELKAFAKQIKIKPKVEMVANDESVDLYLYGDIVEEVPTDWYSGEPLEGEFIYPEKVRNVFDEIGEEKTVNLHLNSGGGDVYASVSISNFIRERKNPVNIYIDAIAASGASIIAMAADNLYMYPNSMMMIHRAAAMAYGNTDDFAKISADLKKFDEVVCASYLNRFKGTEEELTALIKEETYFTAKECLAVGLADEIVDNPYKEEKATVENKQTLDAKVSILQRFNKDSLKVSAKENLLTKFKGEK